MPSPEYGYSVFINCPLDPEYRPLFEAIVFAVHDCGYVAHSALQVEDASEVRIEKIIKLIGNCKFGIHDISRADPDVKSKLPRFNMPLELGIFLGAKRFGRAEQREKVCLVLDIERYRYQQFISDIAGQDIAEHEGVPDAAIKAVRKWLRNATAAGIKIPGPSSMIKRYQLFRQELPAMCDRLNLKEDELTFNEYVLQLEEWLKLNSAAV